MQCALTNVGTVCDGTVLQTTGGGGGSSIYTYPSQTTQTSVPSGYMLVPAPRPKDSAWEGADFALYCVGLAVVMGGIALLNSHTGILNPLIDWMGRRSGSGRGRSR